MIGTVIEGRGGFYTVRSDGELYVLRAQKKLRRQGRPLTGDRVVFTPGKGEKHGWLEEILPRTSLLRRPPVANVKKIALVVAALLILLRVGRPLWHSVAAGERFSDARGWVAERWEALGDWVDGLWGDAYLRENDRRAPTRVRPTVTSEPEGASVSDESSVQ